MPDEGNHEKPKLADQLAMSMLENLALINEAMRKGHELQERLIGLLDEQIDWFNVVDRTFEILKEEMPGKKLTTADVAKAWCAASEEIFDEEEEESDEPDQGDPLVGSGRG